MLRDNYIRTDLPENNPQLLQLVIDDRSFQFSVLHAGCEQFDLSWQVDNRRVGHAHPLYHLVLYVEGEGSFMFCGREYPCVPGTLVISSPGERHEFPPRVTEAVSYLEMTFEYIAGEDRLMVPIHRVLSAYAGIDLPNVPYPYLLAEAQWKQLAGMVRWAMEQLTAEEMLSQFMAAVTCTQIFAFLCQDVYHTATGAHAPAGVNWAKRELDRRYREQLSVQELADALQLSVAHFSRTFKAHFGISPVGYQMRLRINAAKNLLLTTNLSCKEIAERVGFSDQYYFSKAFHQATDMSPTAFRGQRTIQVGEAHA